MKRFLALVLAITITVTLLPQIVLAGSNEHKSGAFTYTIKGNGTVAITGYSWSTMVGQDIYIPRMLDGYTVTEIAEEAFAYIEYDAAHIPINRIIYNAGSLVIPDTVTTIGKKAFWGISFNTKVINIPNSVAYIGAGAFSNIDGIEQFSVAVENPTYTTIDGVLFNKTEKALFAFPKAKYDLMYHDNFPQDVWYRIPNGILKIDDYAFFNVTEKGKLLIKLPETLTTIGAYSFAHTGIGTDEIRTGYGGGGVNYGIELILPSTVSHIGPYAFATPPYGHEYAIIDLSKTSIKEIPPYAFYKSKFDQGNEREGIDVIAWPENLEVIGNHAFANSKYYTNECELTIPASVKVIKEGAFSGFEGILYVNKLLFAENSKLETIENNAFYGADIGTAVVLPNGLKSIGNDAFNNCVYLESLSLPDSVTAIGDNVCIRDNVWLQTTAGSYAALYASENGYMMPQQEEDTSWLN